MYEDEKGIVGDSCCCGLAFEYGPERSGDAPKTMEAVKGTPTVDGKIDEIWKTANKQAVELQTQNVVATDTTTKGEVYTMWDDNNFYALVVITDENVHVEGGANPEDRDSCEVQIDEKNSKGQGNVPSGDPAAGSFRVGADGKKSGFGDKYTEAGENFQGVSVKTDTGYIVEMAIPFSEITPKAGTVIGMEIQINDSKEGKGRTGIVTWNSLECQGWNSSAYHGEVKLAAGDGDEVTESTPTTSEEGSVSSEEEETSSTGSSVQTGDMPPFALAIGAVILSFGVCLLCVLGLKRKGSH